MAPQVLRGTLRPVQGSRRPQPLELLDPEPFVNLPRPPRLGRFSRYWREAEPVVWEGYSPAR